MAHLLLYSAKLLPTHPQYGELKGGVYEIYIFAEVSPVEMREELAKAYATKWNIQLLKAAPAVEIPADRMHLLPQDVKYALSQTPDMPMFGVFVGYREGSEPEDIDPVDWMRED